MLNLISTPIGNLNDISLRAIEALKSADYIFAEDTRNAKKLLNFIDCRSKCSSFHEHQCCSTYTLMTYVSYTRTNGTKT